MKRNSVAIDIGFSFALMLAVVLLLDFSGVAAMSLAAAAVHECGHIAAMKLLGRSPRKIKMRLSGVYITQDSEIHSLRSDAVVAASGPAANLICAAIMLAVNMHLNSDVLWLFGFAMLVMGSFNLLPISGLDGGDLLRIFAMSTFSEHAAAAIIKWSSLGFAVVLMAAGVGLFFTVGNGCLALIGVYIMLFSLFPREVA